MPVISFTLDGERHDLAVSRVPCCGERLDHVAGPLFVRAVVHTPDAAASDATVRVERFDPTPRQHTPQTVLVPVSAPLWSPATSARMAAVLLALLSLPAADRAELARLLLEAP